MNLASFRSRAGLRAVLCSLLFLSIAQCQIGAEPVPAYKPGIYPDWWFTRSVIPRKDPAESTYPTWPASYRQIDDFAVLNEGQLKHLATAAYDEFEWQVHGGAGTEIAELVQSWYEPGVNGVFPEAGARIPRVGVTSGYTAITLGQLKAVAALFYDRLIEEGICPDYPWSYSGVPADDYAVANLGQAKNLFRFVFGWWLTPNEYGLMDWFEAALGSPEAVNRARGTYPGGPRDPNDSDYDGVPDYLDAWPFDAALHGKPIPVPHYAVI